MHGPVFVFEQQRGMVIVQIGKFGGQVPQLTRLPQLSVALPHSLPLHASPAAAQPQTFGVPAPPQVSGEEQLPQSSIPPQPLGTLPQSLPRSLQVLGVQPHRLAVPPPPQVSGEVQVPQSSVPPQPSPMDPQSLPSAEQVVLVQGFVPHLF